MGQKKSSVIACIIALISLLAMPFVAYAGTTSDATITFQSVHVYRNLVETGDMEIVFHWKWTTDNISSYPASSAVLISMSYGGTNIGGTHAFVFPVFANNGYGDAAQGFYFSANSSPVWGRAYVITVAGMSGYFTTPPSGTHTLTSAEYSTASAQEAERLELKSYILDLCNKFKSIYSLTGTTELSVTTDNGTFLSATGESYFNSTILGLQILCPKLFLLQTYVPATMATTPYDMTLAQQRSAILDGSDLRRGVTRLGSPFGVNGDFVWGFFTFIICVGIIMFVSKRGWPVELGYVADGLIAVGMAYTVGSIVFTLVMVLGLVAIIAVSWALIGKKA